MTKTEMTEYITGNFDHIQIAAAGENSFFFYSPSGQVPERTFPFATLVAQDEYDSVSNLNRPGIFRLNIGVSKATYTSLLGSLPSAPGASGVVETGHDFTALDQIMP